MIPDAVEGCVSAGRDFEDADAIGGDDGAESFEVIDEMESDSTFGSA